MQCYHTSVIGTSHANHNEDFISVHKISKNRIALAVMDGCTMGTDSFFASALIGKIIKKYCLDFHYKAFFDQSRISLKEQLKELSAGVFKELSVIKNQLMMEEIELLSTLILGLVDSEEQTAEILVSGDGFVSWNDNLIEFDQKNHPDYLAFYLKGGFEQWYAGHAKHLSLKEIEDLSLATDGLVTFCDFELEERDEVTEIEIIQFLLKDREGADYSEMLHKKLLYIQHEWGKKPMDDLSIIRLMW